MIKQELKKPKRKGKPPINKKSKLRNRIPISSQTALLPRSQYASEPRLPNPSKGKLQSQEFHPVKATYTMDRRKRRKKKNPAKEYLKLKGSQNLPSDLKKVLKQDEKINQKHLVGIYGTSGEKDILKNRAEMEHKFAPGGGIRARSHSAAKREYRML